MSNTAYTARYLAAMKRLAGNAEPRSVVIDGPHDVWCACWNGGSCNCDPDIKPKDGTADGS